MSSTILKFYSTNEKEESRVINSNDRMDQRLQEIMAMASLSESDEDYRADDDEGGDGTFEGFNMSDIDRLTADSAGGSVIKAPDPEDLIKEAQEKADEIVATAEQLAAEYKENSRREADIECNRLRNDARQEGYDSGFRQAQSEYDSRLKALDLRQQELELQYNQAIGILEPQLVDAITDIYSHIFKVELSGYQSILTQLITDTMHKSDNSRNFIIHVSPEDYTAIGTEQRGLLTSAASGSKVDVVQDIGLIKNQCLLETDNGVLDCGLDTQLTELRKKLMLLSYTPSSGS